MPQITLNEEFVGGLRSTFALLMSSSLFEEFHNSVQKHRDAKGAEFEDFGNQRMKRSVSYVIPEHGVLKLLKQGDTHVTQDDVALFDESGEHIEVVSVSVSEGGDLAKSVYLKAYWDMRVKKPPQVGTDVELLIEYSFSAPRLVRSLIEKGLRGEITNRHTKMITFFAAKDVEIPVESRKLCLPSSDPDSRIIKNTISQNISSTVLPDGERAPPAAEGTFFALIEDDKEFSCRQSIASVLKNSMTSHSWEPDNVRGSWGGFTFKSCIDDDEDKESVGSPPQSPPPSPPRKKIQRRPPQLSSNNNTSEKTKLLRSSSPDMVVVPCWRRCFS